MWDFAQIQFAFPWWKIIFPKPTPLPFFHLIFSSIAACNLRFALIPAQQKHVYRIQKNWAFISPYLESVLRILNHHAVAKISIEMAENASAFFNFSSDVIDTFRSNIILDIVCLCPLVFQSDWVIGWPTGLLTHSFVNWLADWLETDDSLLRGVHLPWLADHFFSDHSLCLGNHELLQLLFCSTVYKLNEMKLESEWDACLPAYCPGYKKVLLTSAILHPGC